MLEMELIVALARYCYARDQKPAEQGHNQTVLFSVLCVWCGSGQEGPSSDVLVLMGPVIAADRHVSF
uniref:Uncharacterized protein n=1 Tax=Anguilla anguilla TaxID=7936 RepID=A0A0E9X9N2_ANGAN